jgi:GNAT superfamily N-acetyltransferase
VGDYQICAASAADAPLISALCQKTIRQSNAADYSADEINAVCEDFSVEKVMSCMLRRYVVVLKHHGLIAGTVSLDKDKLHSLFVSPELQGFGYGAILVEYIENYARKSGVASMCVSSSITAQGFYKRLGYQAEGRNTHPNGATFFMTKQFVKP